MTLNDDGSGTMLVELSGLQAALFASRLRFDMEWTLDRQKLVLYVLGGRGPETTKLALQAAAAGLAVVEVQPVDANGPVPVPAAGGGGCGSGGCGSHHEH